VLVTLGVRADGDAHHPRCPVWPVMTSTAAWREVIRGLVERALGHADPGGD